MNTLKLALEMRESTDFFAQMVQIIGYRVSTRTALVIIRFIHTHTPQSGTECHESAIGRVSTIMDSGADGIKSAQAG